MSSPSFPHAFKVLNIFLFNEQLLAYLPYPYRLLLMKFNVVHIMHRVPARLGIGLGCGGAFGLDGVRRNHEG